VRRGGSLALAGLIAATGCAEKTVTVRTITPGQTQSSWIGRNMDDVLAKWGSPSSREPDGRGGAILVYEKTVSTLKESSNPATDMPGAVLPEQTIPVKKPLAKFWVDQNRKVYRIEFSDEVYEKGQDLVPPAKTE
jgi:hypothetical protein